MQRSVSLQPTGLHESFDSSVHGQEPVVHVAEDASAQVIRVEFAFPGFTVSDDVAAPAGQDGEFSEVGIDGAGWLSEGGRPLLPSFGRFVQIPPGCDYTFSVSPGPEQVFDGLRVVPAQEAARDGAGKAEDEFDSALYASDAFYPDEIVEVTGPYDIDDYAALLVHVRPLQVNPKRGVLQARSNITVEIALTSRQRDASDTATAAPSREGFGNLLLNPGRSIANRFPELALDRAVDPPDQARGPELLVIYDPALEVAAHALAKWKKERGLHVEAVSVDAVGNTVGDIKRHIRSRRHRLSRLRYVLLLGDTTAIVTEQSPQTTSDHYFFTSRDATSNSDCVLPWVAGGRIPVSTRKDATSVVDQIIQYEKDPPCDPQYYRRMTFAAFFQDDPPMDGRADRAYMKTMESIRTHMTGIGFNVERIYVSNNPSLQQFKDGSSVPAEVQNSIVDGADATDRIISENSEGQLLVGHRDHGGPDGWAHPRFKVKDLEAIRSAYPSILYSINCLTGQFDASPTDSFAEAALKLNGGPPSLVAATELSGTWRNDSMMKALFDALWPGVIPTFPGSTASFPVRANRLGDVLAYAKSYLLVAHGATGGVRHHFEIYHVIGDPTLQLWAQAPGSVTVSATLRGLALRVRLSHCPDGATLTVWYGDHLLKRIEPHYTQLTIPLRDRLVEHPPGPRPRRGQLRVCFSAPGYRFAEAMLAPPALP